MNAIIYRELKCIQRQKKNIALSLIIVFSLPIIMSLKKYSFISKESITLMFLAIIPSTICLQFSNYTLLCDKRDKMDLFILSSNINKFIYMGCKIVIPIILSFLFDLILIGYEVLFIKDIHTSQEITFYLTIGILAALLASCISFMVIYIVKDEMYYQLYCVIGLMLVLVALLNIINPYKSELYFGILIIIVSIIILAFTIKIMDKRIVNNIKYNQKYGQNNF